MRPSIDDHDYETKMKAIHKFIGEGDKVKVTLRFRGRELAHGQLGMQLLQRVQEDTNEIAKIEQYPRMEGRQMLLVISPKYAFSQPESKARPTPSLRISFISPREAAGAGRVAAGKRQPTPVAPREGKECGG